MKLEYLYVNNKRCGVCKKKGTSKGCRVLKNKNKELLRICNECYGLMGVVMARHVGFKINKRKIGEKSGITKQTKRH